MKRVLALLALFASATALATGRPPRIGHVFIIVLENQSYRMTFGPESAAPFLARELPKQGVLLKEYYGTGHASLDNYISMVSGQAPNRQTQDNCRTYTEFTGSVGAGGQAVGEGCVYPKEVITIGQQLEAHGRTWKNYAEDSALGNPPACRHVPIGQAETARKGTPTDQYVTKHVPWMYFHAVIDDDAYCRKHAVDLVQLERDLGSLKATPNLVFIVPDVCSDGHDPVCPDGKSPGGFAGIDAFLKTWVPKILASAAYQKDGMLIVTFDEADANDPVEGSLSCCDEPSGPNVTLPGGDGPGGGRTGTVVLSRFVTPGTVSDVPYNHYSLLRSLEDIFSLPYLGYAGQPGLKAFGEDVYGRR